GRALDTVPAPLQQERHAPSAADWNVDPPPDGGPGRERREGPVRRQLEGGREPPRAPDHRPSATHEPLPRPLEPGCAQSAHAGAGSPLQGSPEAQPMTCFVPNVPAGAMARLRQACGVGDAAVEVERRLRRMAATFRGEGELAGRSLCLVIADLVAQGWGAAI